MWIGIADQRCLPSRFGLPLKEQTPISLSQMRFRKGRRDFARISIMETEGEVLPGMLRSMASGLCRTKLSTYARELQLLKSRSWIVGGQLATLPSQFRPGAFVARLNPRPACNRDCATFIRGRIRPGRPPGARASLEGASDRVHRYRFSGLGGRLVHVWRR